MNQTLLTLLSVLALYGLSSFAVPRSDRDLQDDSMDIQASDMTSEPSLLPKDDDPNADA